MTSQLSQHIHRRHGLLAALCAVAAVCAALSAYAAYDSMSSSSDIMDSCTSFTVDSAGVLTATCNVWDDIGQVKRTQQHTIDLDERVGFDGTALKTHKTGFSDKCKEEVTSLTSDNKLNVAADCSETGKEGTYVHVSVRIDDLMYNRGYEGPGQTVGLYWSSTKTEGGDAPLGEGATD